MKRIATIQDISCIGKCSLTVALPIISAFGIETAIIPTAVLSTHTAFENFTFKDLTDEIRPIYEHWKSEGFGFDAIYTGYLGSERQIDIVADFFEKFRTEDNIIVADPAMGDMGKLYKGFDTAFAHRMATLCAQADIVVPNLTEACFMLDEPYTDMSGDEEYIKNLLIRLCEHGSKISVITGITPSDNTIGAMMYDSTDNAFFSYYTDKANAAFHGTGDIFASTLTGALTTGCTLQKALEIAVDYTAECIRFTLLDKKSNWYGVNFEQALPYLIDKIK